VAKAPLLGGEPDKSVSEYGFEAFCPCCKTRLRFPASAVATLLASQVGTLLRVAGAAGLEPVTSAVTGQRSNQLSYAPAMGLFRLEDAAGGVKRH
jgi:hypothetical protein